MKHKERPVARTYKEFFMLHYARTFFLTLTVALCLSAASPASAAEIVFVNDTDGAVYALWNYPGPSDSSGFLGSVGRNSEMKLTPSDLKECERLVVSQGAGFAYQFFMGAEALRTAKTITLTMEQLQSSAIQRYPLLVIEGGEDAYYVPAGIPLDILADALAFGLATYDFGELLIPEGQATLDRDAFAVAFGDISWHIVNMQTGELAEPGDEYVTGLGMVATYTNSSLSTMLSLLQDMGARPTVLGNGGDTGMAFSPEDVHEGLPLAKGLSEDADDSEVWGVFMEQLGTSDTDYDIRMEFSSETFHFELTLQPNDSSAVFYIVRHEDAPVG